MKTDNELIEDFFVSNGGKPSMKEDLSFYESDWSMLIPVVEKINDLNTVVEIRFNRKTYTTTTMIASFLPKWNKDIKITEAGIESLYYAVVEFIEWYNENKV